MSQRCIHLPETTPGERRPPPGRRTTVSMRHMPRSEQSTVPCNPRTNLHSAQCPTATKSCQYLPRLVLFSLSAH